MYKQGIKVIFTKYNFNSIFQLSGRDADVSSLHISWHSIQYNIILYFQSPQLVTGTAQQCWQNESQWRKTQVVQNVYCGEVGKKKKKLGADRSVVSYSAGLSRFPSYHYGTQSRLPPGFVPWDPAPVFLHCFLPSGESVIHTNHSYDAVFLIYINSAASIEYAFCSDSPT